MAQRYEKQAVLGQLRLSHEEVEEALCSFYGLSRAAFTLSVHASTTHPFRLTQEVSQSGWELMDEDARTRSQEKVEP